MQTLLSTSSRRYDLDWLRVIAFSLLILYHTGMFFVEWEWHIKNNRISEALKLPMLFVNQWRMPLLFFISGAGVYFALGKRGGGSFARERWVRLFIPLFFGMLMIVPPQIYFERLTQGATFSYAEFYPSVFQFIPYPAGSFSWHHLWYVAYILVYSLICLPLFLYLKSERGSKLTSRLAGFFAWKGAIFLFMVPLFISDALLRPHWETTHNLIADWANFTFSLLIFVYGFLICSDGRFWQAIERQRRVALVASLIAVTAFFCLFEFDWIDWGANPSPWLVGFYRFLKDVNIWCWLLAILGYGKKYLNFTNPGLRYANEAVYPFYILHQSVIITLAYHLIGWQASIAVKFILISGATFLVCWVLYEFIIRRTSVTRVLFGLKPFAARPVATQSTSTPLASR